MIQRYTMRRFERNHLYLNHQGFVVLCTAAGPKQATLSLQGERLVQEGYNVRQDSIVSGEWFDVTYANREVLSRIIAAVNNLDFYNNALLRHQPVFWRAVIWAWHEAQEIYLQSSARVNTLHTPHGQAAFVLHGAIMAYCYEYPVYVHGELELARLAKFEAKRLDTWQRVASCLNCIDNHSIASAGWAR